MESSNNETPPPRAAAPDRPSLLGSGPRSGSDTGSPTRMLASLGPDGMAPKSGPRGTGRPRRGFVIAGLVVAAGVGVALFSSTGLRIDASAPAASPLASSSLSAVQGSQAGSAVALAVPVAATLVPASSPASIETATVDTQGAATTASTAPTASARMTAASRPATHPLDRLALDGAEAVPEPKPAASSAAAHARKSHPNEATAKLPRAGGAGGAVSAKAGATGIEPAGARKAHKGDVDADTELVAAIIARLDRRGALPSPGMVAGLSKQDDPGTADRLRKCDAKSDLLDARRCRNKVCEKRWGKSYACPASRAPRDSTGAGADHG